MKVLLTGGSGFIAAHCLDVLLEHGHDVVTTVRSNEKGEFILKNHPGLPKSKLSYVVVEDIADEHAFDKAIKSDPPFEGILHTASPFHYRFKEADELIIPAINGTVGILKAAKAHAPSVKRVVITSSFAAIMSPSNHPPLYDESCWNPVTRQEVEKNVNEAYRASKTFAEQAAWKFVEEEKPNFTIATVNPPLVFGPVVHYLNSIDSINTSNQRVAHMITGKMKKGLAPTANFLWVDVRDIALAHVKALEVPEAGGKRFFITSGFQSNAEVADIIKKNFPEYKDQLPEHYKDDRDEITYKFDNSRSKEVLGLKYRSLEPSIVDLVKSLKEIGV